MGFIHATSPERWKGDRLNKGQRQRVCIRKLSITHFCASKNRKKFLASRSKLQVLFIPCSWRSKGGRLLLDTMYFMRQPGAEVAASGNSYEGAVQKWCMGFNSSHTPLIFVLKWFADYHTMRRRNPLHNLTKGIIVFKTPLLTENVVLSFWKYL